LTLSSWGAYVAPRDANSYTENTPFLTTAGTATNFLNINPGLPTYAESNGASVNLVTDDYAGTVRSPVMPDIGAWEGDFLPNMLPIELMQFTAKCGNEKVQVEWETASEHDNDIFILERSIDAHNWETRTKIEGTANSGSRKVYSYSDEKDTASDLYYRLKRTDGNKNEKFSEMIRVNNCPYLANEVFIYPNPTKDWICIQAPKEYAATISIYDALGNKVGAYALNDKTTSIDIKNLLPGVYLIKISNGDTTKTQKLIVNNTNN
jgi:hypothetical protein